MKIGKLTFAMLLIVVIAGCSTATPLKADMFYGETTKWIVIAYPNNRFSFAYKGKIDDLKTEETSSINFSYGSSLGTVSDVQFVTDSSFFTQEFKVDYISNLVVGANFNKDKYINVKISYGETIDSIDLSAYIQNPR